MQYSIPRMLLGEFRICMIWFRSGARTPSKSSPVKLRGFLKYSVSAWHLAEGKDSPLLKDSFRRRRYSSGSFTRISASSIRAETSPYSLPKQRLSTICSPSSMETPPKAKDSALAVLTDTGISSTRSAPHRSAISARTCFGRSAGVPLCT